MYVCVWACTPVLRVRSEDVTLWSFITSVTRFPPVLRYAEAMFYKRITRQRAPAGHPLPPRATYKHVRIDSQISSIHCTSYLFSAETTALIVLLPFFLCWRTLYKFDLLKSFRLFHCPLLVLTCTGRLRPRMEGISRFKTQKAQDPKPACVGWMHKHTVQDRPFMAHQSPGCQRLLLFTTRAFNKQSSRTNLDFS